MTPRSLGVRPRERRQRGAAAEDKRRDGESDRQGKERQAGSRESEREREREEGQKMPCMVRAHPTRSSGSGGVPRRGGGDMDAACASTLLRCRPAVAALPSTDRRADLADLGSGAGHSGQARKRASAVVLPLWSFSLFHCRSLSGPLCAPQLPPRPPSRTRPNGDPSSLLPSLLPQRPPRPTCLHLVSHATQSPAPPRPVAPRASHGRRRRHPLALVLVIRGRRGLPPAVVLP